MKPIQNFDGYFITNTGEVFSSKSKRFIKLHVGTSGYLSTSLRSNGKTVPVMIHRVVAKEFVPNFFNRNVVNHKDGNKLNNRFENLEWCTYHQNAVHAQKYGLTPKPPSWKGKTGYFHNKSIEVLEYSSSGEITNRFGSFAEAARERGVHVSTIFLCVKNNTKTRAGFYYRKVI